MDKDDEAMIMAFAMMPPLAPPPPPLPPPIRPAHTVGPTPRSSVKPMVSSVQHPDGLSNLKSLSTKGTKRFQKEMQFRLVGAIEQQNLANIHKLIENGVDLDCTILYAKTPLLHAVEQGYNDVAELLLQEGANPNKAETIAWQRRPLHMAVIKDSSFMVKRLISSGATIDAQDGCGMTSLHHACYLGRRDIMDLLLKAGACIQQGDFVERDSLHRAIEGRHLDIAETLLRHKMCIDGPDKFGWTPLFHCVVADDITGAKFLIENGASVNTRDHNGYTPLHIACNRLSKSNVRIMLATSSDFYYRMRRIPTVEIQRLLQDDTDSDMTMLQLLVNTGADVNKGDDVLTRPIHMTFDPSVIKFLIVCGAFVDYDMMMFSYLFRNEEESDSAPAWLTEEFQLQTTLQRLCRVCIRSHLRPTRDIRAAITILPLPQSLKNFLNAEEIFFT